MTQTLSQSGPEELKQFTRPLIARLHSTVFGESYSPYLTDAVEIVLCTCTLPETSSESLTIISIIRNYTT